MNQNGPLGMDKGELLSKAEDVADQVSRLSFLRPPLSTGIFLAILDTVPAALEALPADHRTLLSRLHLPGGRHSHVVPVVGAA